jgi:hypothetical protein
LSFTFKHRPLDPLKFSLKWDVSFGDSVGAVLFMYRPVITRFEQDGNLKSILQLLRSELNVEILVTETVTTPAYAMLVSSGDDQSATVDFAAAAPLAVHLNVGAGIHFSWSCETKSGLWKAGSELGCTYMPLFTLSTLRTWYRPRKLQLFHHFPEGMGLNSGPEMVVQSFNPPWRALDEDYEEIPEECSIVPPPPDYLSSE